MLLRTGLSDWAGYAGGGRNDDRFWRKHYGYPWWRTCFTANGSVGDNLVAYTGSEWINIGTVEEITDDEITLAAVAANSVTASAYAFANVPFRPMFGYLARVQTLAGGGLTTRKVPLLRALRSPVEWRSKCSGWFISGGYHSVLWIMILMVLLAALWCKLHHWRFHYLWIGSVAGNIFCQLNQFPCICGTMWHKRPTCLLIHGLTFCFSTHLKITKLPLTPCGVCRQGCFIWVFLIMAGLLFKAFIQQCTRDGGATCFGGAKPARLTMPCYCCKTVGCGYRPAHSMMPWCRCLPTWQNALILNPVVTLVASDCSYITIEDQTGDYNGTTNTWGYNPEDAAFDPSRPKGLSLICIADGLTIRPMKFPCGPFSLKTLVPTRGRYR